MTHPEKYGLFLKHSKELFAKKNKKISNLTDWRLPESAKSERDLKSKNVSGKSLYFSQGCRCKEKILNQSQTNIRPDKAYFLVHPNSGR